MVDVRPEKLRCRVASQSEKRRLLTLLFAAQTEFLPSLLRLPVSP
jgi:hypothetical protein